MRDALEEPRDRPLRVAFVSHTADRYGAELALLELTAALTRRGVDCFVVLPGRGRMIAALAEIGVPYRIVAHHWWAADAGRSRRIVRGLLNLGAAVRLARLLVRWRIDVVCTNTAVVPTGAVAALLARRPHVWTLHEVFAGEHAMSFDLGAKTTLRLVARLSDVAVVNSNAVRRQIAGAFPNEHLHVIRPMFRSPCDGEVAHDPGEDRCTPRIVVVGKVAANKGQMDALVAVTLLAREGRRVEVVLIGDAHSAYAARARRVANELGGGCDVKFVGYQENPAAMVASADVVVGCARDESFGRAIVEALAAARPVVVARTAATEELIEHGVSGWLYRIGDSRGLASVIAYVLDHRSEARRVACAGRAHVRRMFAQDDSTTGMLELLRRAAQRGRGGTARSSGSE